MPEERRERADAARNRSAILRATEELLASHRPEEITIEQVAAAAGVGKGTVFHRFGSRMGLMVALMQERALDLTELVEHGPPPLGPGAPARERLLAFLTAVVEVVGRNKGLLAALGHTVTTARRHSNGDDHPVYRHWHGHISALLAEARPDLDADLLANLLLAGLHTEPILRLLERGETKRLAASLRVLTEGIVGPS
ncbi:MAG TPA: helix-turn-helix domain-containing protein [Mycobacterium sp.]|nr:helix-turn-helix domain-containing protein [Mycobacterium sp.]